jgi:hypothetical protein
MDKDKNLALLTSMDEVADVAYQKWPNLIDMFESDSALAQTRGVMVEDIAALGQMLQQWETYQRFCENNGSLSDLGSLPKHALEIITADFGTSIMPHIASVQPIRERVGIIYFKTVKTTKTRGGMTAGDTLQHPFYPPHNTGAVEPYDPANLRYPGANNQMYAGEEQVATFTLTGITNTRVYADEWLGSSTLKIRPRSVRVTGTVDTEAGPLTFILVDDGAGNLLGNGVHGTVRYVANGGNAGITNLIFTEELTNGTANLLTITYASDFEESGDVPELNFTIDYTDITAEIFALTQATGMFKAFEFSNRFGQSAEEMVARDLTGALNMEIGNAAISRIAAACDAQANNTVTFNIGIPQTISYTEHMQQLKALIMKASSTILNHAGRGHVNYLICGANAAGVISTLPGWKQQIIDTPGANIWGSLDGMTVIRAPHINVNDIYCVYRGKGGFDTPMVYSPYMPLVVSKTLQDIDNILKNRAVAAVWAGLKVVAPTFITKIRLVEDVYTTPPFSV